MRILGVFCLLSILGVVAAADTAKPTVAYTITADNITITGNDDQSVIVQERGKKPVKLLVMWSAETVYQILNESDMSIRAMATKDGNTFTLKSGDVANKVLATITDDGAVTLPGGSKKLSFDAKGQLVNGSRKVKVTPAARGKQAETMAVLVTLLNGRL